MMSAKMNRHCLGGIGDFHPNDLDLFWELIPKIPINLCPTHRDKHLKDCTQSLYVAVRGMRYFGEVSSDNNMGIFSLRTNELCRQTLLESLTCFPFLNPGLCHNCTFNP